MSLEEQSYLPLSRMLVFCTANMHNTVHNFERYLLMNERITKPCLGIAYLSTFLRLGPCELFVLKKTGGRSSNSVNSLSKVQV
jgi:hypothetical protein